MEQEIKVVFNKTYSYRYYELTVENIILCEDKIRIAYNAKNTMENRVYRMDYAEQARTIFDKLLKDFLNPSLYEQFHTIVAHLLSRKLMPIEYINTETGKIFRLNPDWKISFQDHFFISELLKKLKSKENE